MRTLVRSVTWQPETLDAGSCARRNFPEDLCRDDTDARKLSGGRLAPVHDRHKKMTVQQEDRISNAPRGI
ncbi:hypothetical protein NDU88_004386 [Pleurodeles waltl]|uniref:Uncharacterized protein n=1 Tax=Pleurodeles waltl TaxID=8319 RepID=A0AAV7UGC9_PLEWA|nr:hypothetical protein NDU88_004386 [Pleurodeles waltl]